MLILAGLALFLKILIPPGYMAAPAKPDGPAFALMLCTAQGMVSLDAAAVEGTGHLDESGESIPTNDDGARHSPCVFAGHGLNAPAPDPLHGDQVVFEQPADQPRLARTDVTPGRGLAAPPPPARGPPPLQA